MLIRFLCFMLLRSTPLGPLLRPLLRPLAASAVIGLSACAAPTPPPAAAPAPAAPPVQAAPAVAPPPPVSPAPAPVAPSPGAQALQAGVGAFGQGEYRRAETKLLESFKLGLNTIDETTKAYKTQAFLYCVTNRVALCEKSFQTAFDMDPKFDLSRAERGHPVWGPVFARVQKKNPR